jgi:hypothetical protein
MPAKQPNKRGRPKVDIDWDKVGKMLEAGCSAVGIAATIGCDEDTLRKRCPADNNCTFSEFSQQKKAKGDELLRTKQFQVAMTGDKTMLVWLGKQRLGQADKQEIGNKDGEAFKQEVEVIFTNDGNG